MRVHKAKVIDTRDPYESGYFFVRSKELQTNTRVTYVSPFLDKDKAGFISMPSIGSDVLITQADNDSSWFYLGTVSAPRKEDALAPEVGNAESSQLPDNKMYRARRQPMRYIWKTPKGGQITLSDEYNSGFFNVKVEAKTPKGKKIVLNDSPKVDAIIIENREGDRIKISSKANGISGNRSIEVEAKGRVNITSRESSIKIWSVDGKQIDILNTSTGSKRAGSSDPTPGNINITSKHADVNVTTQGENGDIHLTTEGESGNIVLQSKKGVVQIHGAKGVDIEGADGDGNVVSNVVVKGTRIDLN